VKPIHYILFCCLLGLSSSGYSQTSVENFEKEKTSKFYIGEFYLSINSTLPSFTGLHPKIGGGIGARLYLLKDTRVNAILGLEINRNSVVVDNFDVHHYYNVDDVTVDIYTLTIPLGLQLNIDSKKRFFLETGFFMDIALYGNNKKAGGTFLGPSGGLGVKIPKNKYNLVFKLDYKYGIKTAGGQTHGEYSNGFKNTQARIIVGINL